jgi:hypothetical protein
VCIITTTTTTKTCNYNYKTHTAHSIQHTAYSTERRERVWGVRVVVATVSVCVIYNCYILYSTCRYTRLRVVQEAPGLRGTPPSRSQGPTGSQEAPPFNGVRRRWGRCRVEFRSRFRFRREHLANHAQPQPRFFCMVNQVRVRAGHARPLADTVASQTLARSDREIGGSKMGP